jgi:hypothetical protein
MRFQRKKPDRRGVTLVEAAIVLLVFLMLVLGMLDLGLGVLQYNSVSHAARQGARQAIVHGWMAPTKPPWYGGPWGPPGSYPGANPYTVNGANSSDWIVKALQDGGALAGLDPNTVTIQVQWPDGSNNPDNRVSVTVSSSYSPIMTWIFGNHPITLSATSTMLIAH